LIRNLGAFATKSPAASGGLPLVIRFWGTLQPIPPAFGGMVFFILFPHSCKQGSVIKQKIPRLCLRDWLRSVADYFMIRNLGAFATKSPAALRRQWSFLFSSLGIASMP
jgi:hypothetical protein